MAQQFFFFKKNGPTPASFLFIFVFSNKQQIWMWKWPSSIRHRDSYSQTSDYESPPLTTRPGLPPNLAITYICLYLYLPRYQDVKAFCWSSLPNCLHINYIQCQFEGNLFLKVLISTLRYVLGAKFNGGRGYSFHLGPKDTIASLTTRYLGL